MKAYIFIVGLLMPYVMLSQTTVTGTVTNDQNEPLFAASVHWVNTTVGTTTDDLGQFELPTDGIKDRRLVASFLMHQADTILVGESGTIDFVLRDLQTLEDVVVKSRREGIITSNLSPIKTEQITQTELAKAACCDLAGCFETQISVKPHTTNVITNSKELRVLGLSGVYNQILIDGFPMIQGLSHTYGISSYPGTLVENIFVSKGANSVLQGYDGMTGQINVITTEPDKTAKLFLNGYINSFGEKQLNANYASKIGDWSNVTAVHTVQPAAKVNTNDDGFLDVPLLTRYMAFNKLKYGNPQEWGWSSYIGLRYVNEERIGGQEDFDAKTDKGSTSVYGQLVQLQQPEFWTRTGYRFNDDYNIVLYASGYHQNQNSHFGTVKYDAEQTNFYGNLQFEWNWKFNALKTGISYRHLNIDEDISFSSNILSRSYAGNYLREDNIAGVFVENTMSFLDDRLTWIAGVRADHHNQHGMHYTPRTLLKYDFSPRLTVRANVGTGWRTVNLFSENVGLLVSSRDVVFEEKLNPEKSLNYGINATQKFGEGDFSGFISGDYYRTSFSNQIFPDYDTDPTKAIIRNYTGTSISEAFQAEVYFSLWDRVEIKTGYTTYDVYREANDQRFDLPFNPSYKVISTFGYKPLFNKYQFDMNIHFYGKKRLPDTKSNPVEYQRPDYSQPYTTFNAQFTYRFNDFELYTGCENIFNFRQDKPILGYQNPFGKYFDTSSVWGPTRGREFYLGFRYKVPKR